MADLSCWTGDTVLLKRRLTLDGVGNYLSADDLAAVDCLRELVGRDDAVVAEAVKNAYDARYGRVGALAGIPNLLGWENHERQWRGAGYNAIAGSRRDDINWLYQADDMAQVTELVNRYNISYIFYGDTERAQYGSMGEDMFLDYLPVVCETDASRIFAAHPLRD